MGHHTVSDLVFNHESVEAAYRSLVDNAEWGDEWGYHGSGVVVDSRYLDVVVDSDDKMRIASITDDIEDRTQTYREALAVKVRKVTPAVTRKVRTERVEVELRGEEELQYHVTTHIPESTYKKIVKALAAQGVKRNNIGAVTVNREVKPKYTMRYKAVTGEGKAKTKYFVLRKGSPNGWRTLPKWDEGYDSQALARAAVNGTQEWLYPDMHASQGTEEYEIVGVILREDGGALVESSREVVKAVVTLDVEIVEEVTPRRVTNEVGWLIAGSVHI